MAIKWPVAYPGAHWLDAREERAVLDVLHRRSLFRYYGMKPPKSVARLEQTARSLYDAKFALGVSSGTGALFTAMTALGIGPGCEVIVPAFLWVATVGAVVNANAIPVLCEVDDSLCMDWQDLERKITPRTRLIVAVHMAGAPCDMQRVMAVANRHLFPCWRTARRPMAVPSAAASWARSGCSACSACNGTRTPPRAKAVFW